LGDGETPPPGFDELSYEKEGYVPAKTKPQIAEPQNIR
jgi:hypothetical protein